MSDLYIGIDCSTQSISATVIDAESGSIVHEAAIGYQEHLGERFGVQDAVLPSDHADVVHQPPLMWVAALDLLMDQLKDADIDLASVRGIGGSGQQHGTVYLKECFPQTLAAVDPGTPLADQLGNCFSRQSSPIWMDGSTGPQCLELAKHLGGAEEILQCTGSYPTERFSGPQILKFAQDDGEGYEASTHIRLVSSFIATLLAGELVGTDHTDASGTNLLDIRTKQWVPELMANAGNDLERRLGQPADPRQPVGPIAPYFRQRYGFTADCQIVPFCGDNPASLIGLGLVETGMLAISLGTSDTLFGFLPAVPPQLSGEGHLFAAPTGHWMSLLCFRNGSLARDHIRKRFDLDWDGFADAVSSMPAGNRDGLVLPWVDPEITPTTMHGGIRSRGIAEDDVAAHCRGIVEGQMLAMRLHAERAGIHPHNLRVTGGASVNPAILQIMADVFSCPVETLETTNGAALGGALQARYATLQASGRKPVWSEVVAPFTTTGQTIEPDRSLRQLYHDQVEAYAAFEDAEVAKDHPNHDAALNRVWDGD